MRSPARRLVFALCAVFAIGGAALPAQARISYASLRFTSEPKYASIVVDAKTGEVLYEQNADSPRYPASISKVMTMYLAFEALANGKLSLNDSMMISPHAAAQAPSKVGLRAGQTIAVGDAMNAIAVLSANDMAVALAEKLGGSEGAFAAMMTQKAHELGMQHTHYVNASGLPDTRQISSARDISILSRAVLRDYPQYYAFFGKREFAYQGRVVRNHNHLLGQMPGVDGIKTGFINASGFNIAVSAVRDNRRLIGVIMGGSSTAARDTHAEDLLDAGFTVMRRRAAGETTTLAQNMREPDPTGVVDRPPTEQGDGEQDGLKIVVDGHAAARAVKKTLVKGDDVVQPACTMRRVRGRHHHHHVACVQMSANDAKAMPKGKHGKADHGAWQVQLGAYKDRGLARVQMAKLNHKFAYELESATGRVEHASGNYRVRFAGMSASGARDACEAIKAQGHDCMALGPRG